MNNNNFYLNMINLFLDQLVIFNQVCFIYSLIQIPFTSYNEYFRIHLKIGNTYYQYNYVFIDITTPYTCISLTWGILETVTINNPISSLTVPNYTYIKSIEASDLFQLGDDITVDISDINFYLIEKKVSN